MSRSIEITCLISGCCCSLQDSSEKDVACHLMPSTAILFLFLAEHQQFVSFLYGKVKHRFQIQYFTQCKFQCAEVPKVWSRGHHGTAQETSTSLCLILKTPPPLQCLKSSPSHPAAPHISIQLASLTVNCLYMLLKRPRATINSGRKMLYNRKKPWTGSSWTTILSIYTIYALRIATNITFFVEFFWNGWQ